MRTPHGLSIFTRMDEDSSALDLTFAALAHQTRRRMIEELAVEDVRVTDLAARFDCSLNVASKHILSLERAGLVSRERQGREHRLHLEAAPLVEASAFIDRYRRRWEKQFDQLGSYLDKMAAAERRKRSARSRPQKSRA